MLRTTKKEVKEKIRAYILENMDFTGYIGYDGYPDTEPKTDGEKVILCRDIFRYEYRYNIRGMGEYHAFREWLCGVPSALTVELSYYGARHILESWLEETEEESSRFDDSKMMDQFLHLVAREFFAMVDKAEREKAKKGV